MSTCPSARLEPALELLAEVLLRPTFPADEVERLRDERLNDLLQAQADPRRRADETYIGTIYAPASPYHRPAGAARARPSSASMPTRPARAYERIARPGSRDAGRRPATSAARTSSAIAGGLFGGWARHPTAPRPPARSSIDDAPASGRLVRVVHRPGSVQTEIRIGHRRPAAARSRTTTRCRVMGAILGGLFNSRLNMQLREAKGYTYGAGAGFDMRRGAGPFTARAAVNTEVTVPAILDTIAELERMRDTRVTDDELAAARDFLVGVFPLRFETPGAVVGALSGLAVHGLPLDELTDYRARIEAVDVDAIEAAARAHLLVDRRRDRARRRCRCVRCRPRGGRSRSARHRPGRARGGAARARERGVLRRGPTDEGEEAGPTAGAEDPSLPGLATSLPRPTEPDDARGRPALTRVRRRRRSAETFSRVDVSMR